MVEHLSSQKNKALRFVAEFLGVRSFPSVDLRQMFVALKHRNYRLWVLGQMVSLVGTWMQTAAQGFLIFELTQSSAYLGYASFALGAPSLLFMFFGGVYADRVPRRNLLIITQTIMMLLAFFLAGLTFLDIVRPWHILLLALALGVVTAFDAPTRLSFILEMVDRHDLANAIAINSMLFNLGILIGPAVAGLVYVSLGPAWCFALNGLSFVAVIISLCAMTLKSFKPKEKTTAPFDDLKEGVIYAFSNRVVRALLSLVAILCFFGITYLTLMPAWAVRVLNGDASTNGWLLSARGVGALCGALMVASLGRFQFKGKLLLVGAFVFPIMLLLFANIRLLPLSLLVMIGVGWGNMVSLNLSNALIQSLVAEEFSGRVISLYTFCIFGLLPLGSLLVGLEAEYWGEPLALMINSGVVLLYAVWIFLRVPQVRQH